MLDNMTHVHHILFANHRFWGYRWVVYHRQLQLLSPLCLQLHTTSQCLVGLVMQSLMLVPSSMANACIYKASGDVVSTTGSVHCHTMLRSPPSSSSSTLLMVVSSCHFQHQFMKWHDNGIRSYCHCRVSGRSPLRLHYCEFPTQVTRIHHPLSAPITPSSSNHYRGSPSSKGHLRRHADVSVLQSKHFCQLDHGRHLTARDPCSSAICLQPSPAPVHVSSASTH